MTPLRGRERELDLISAAMESARRGDGRLLAVTGGLGSGKTALLRRLPALAERRGLRTLTAGCAPQEQDFPFGVVGQLLDPLPGCGPLDLVPGPDRSAELLSSVADLSRDQPLLLLVDDLQWADPASLRWLGELAQRLAGLHAVVVVSLREGEPGADAPPVQTCVERAARLVHLAPLPVETVADLVADHLGHPGEPGQIAACHEASGGNPLFLSAALTALAAAGPAAGHALAAPEPRRVALHERLAVALRSQPAPVRRLARALAVLDQGPDRETDPDHEPGREADPAQEPGRPAEGQEPDLLAVPGHEHCREVDVELVSRLAELDTAGCEDAARSLRRLGLLTDGPAPCFAHPAVREAVEESMTPAEHEDIHLRAAQLLHNGGHPAERAAAQLLAVTSCHDAWTVEVLQAAATAARRRGALREASRYLRHALLGSSPSGADRAALLLDLAASERDIDPQAALRHLSQAFLLLPTTTARALAAARTPPFLLGSCPPPVIDIVAKVAADLGDPDTLTGAERQAALRLEARLRHVAVAGPGEMSQCAPRLRALGAAPPMGTAAERELVTVLLHGATVTQRMTGAEVAHQAERVLQHEPASPGHVHTALPHLCGVLAAAESLDAIGPWLTIAQERARRDGASVPRAVIAAELAHVLLARGRLQEARAHAEEAVAHGIMEWATLPAMTALVMVAVQSRDTGLARLLLGHRRETADHDYRPSPLQLLRGSVAVTGGDPATALEYVLDWGRSAERAEWRNPALVPWRSWAAGLHHRLGQTRKAHDLADEEYERAVAWGTPVVIGRARRVKGAITEGERGIELLRESAALLQGSVNAMEAARTELLLGRRLLAAGRGAEAEERLGRARDRALACGVPWIAEVASRELAGPAGSGQQPVAVSALTRAERRVAGLAAHGVPNKNIAERLEVSSRAVEKHLTSAYRKLKVAGRAELAAFSPLLPGPADA
ncbi:LuxR family transcriptional regulator [Streptomyces klenkii]|uniref:Helix-turn-helix transcriptional regulator n=1 Tax=Streptomyces klenkii TaxID=1420899 RepID=A0A3B0BY14_9ACTN|nr:LuxR family transcriptional regulator [Streptomyces klenkii]RKN77258.1 helix-turn-helix transcriptional regulator [Streptomyces klenkii]